MFVHVIFVKTNFIVLSKKKWMNKFRKKVQNVKIVGTFTEIHAKV